MEEHEKIELRSDDVQEILGTPPSWMLSWGTTVIVFGIMILGAVSYWVKYPDMIRANVQITTSIPPLPVVARAGGYLAHLRVKDGDSVRAGDLLVVLQNPANYLDVLKLEAKILDLEKSPPSVLVDFQIDTVLNLGEIQLTYSVFVQSLKDFAFKNRENFAAQNVAAYRRQIENMKKAIKTEQEKIKTAELSYRLAKENYEAKRRVYSEGGSNSPISADDLKEAKQKENNAIAELQNVKSRINEYNGQILQVDKSILETQQTTKESTTTKYTSLIENINQLRSNINTWKQRYLMFAPIDGKISFFNDYWAQNQNVKENDEVMAIIPFRGDRIVGMATLPIAGAGKVREGQTVNIKFDSYPYQQHGIVKGIVENKSLLPKDKATLLVRVKLVNNLRTTYNKELKFEQQMVGTAEIITEDRRFIERIFDKLISAFKNN